MVQNVLVRSYDAAGFNERLPTNTQKFKVFITIPYSGKFSREKTLID